MRATSAGVSMNGGRQEDDLRRRPRRRVSHGLEDRGSAVRQCGRGRLPPAAGLARHGHGLRADPLRSDRPGRREVMTSEQARRFAEEWVDAWNRHDLDGILAHYSEDVVFSSPFAARLIPGGDGTVRGRAALREYFKAG